MYVLTSTERFADRNKSSRTTRVSLLRAYSVSGPDQTSSAAASRSKRASTAVAATSSSSAM